MYTSKDPQLQELNDRLIRLINDGKNVEATSKAVDIRQKPIYFDDGRFHQAQSAVKKYYTNISLASSTGLILLIQIESILIPLLKTGRSRTVANLLDRYVDTALYIRKCYETNFCDTTSEGWSRIQLVRCMHDRVHRLMNKEISLNKEGGGIWVNQHDMALTQFAFIGLFLTHPEKCGAYFVTREELSLVAYYWRLISYYLGIEERFNLFIYHDDINKQLEFTRLILNHFNKLLNSNPRNEIGLKMSQGFMLAFEDFNTESSFNILDHWWNPIVSLSGNEDLEPYNLSEALVKLPLFLLFFRVLFKSHRLHGVLNEMYKRKFDKFCENREKIRKKLEKKYKNHVYELQSSEHSVIVDMI